MNSGSTLAAVALTFLIPLLPSVALSRTEAATDGITLDEAIDEAIRNNLDLAAERYGVSIAQAREITAALRPNPILTVEGETLNAFGAPYGSDSPLGPNQINARTDFVIEKGGKRARRIEVARADRSFAEIQVQDLMRLLVWDVRAGFTEVLQATDSVALAEDTLRTLQGIADLNSLRVRSGDLAQVELDRSRVAVVQYEAQVEQAKLRLEQSGAQLSRLMGRSGTPVRVVGAHALSRRVESLPGLIGRALTNRPDLHAAKQAQVRNQADLRLQLANGKVDYTVGSQYSYQRAFGIGGSTVGFSFSVPLQIYNRNQGEIARAERESQQNQARIAALESAIRNEVEQAYRQYQSAIHLLDKVESSLLVRSRSVRDTTEYSYRRGEASLVEFLDAQRAFNDSIQTYNEARAAVARSSYWIDAVSAANEAPWR